MIDSGNLYEGVFVLKGEVNGAAFAAVQKDNTILWHSRMRHSSNQALRHISQARPSISYYEYFFLWPNNGHPLCASMEDARDPNMSQTNLLYT